MMTPHDLEAGPKVKFDNCKRFADHASKKFSHSIPLGLMIREMLGLIAAILFSKQAF